MNYSDKTPADNHRPWEDHTVAIPDFSIRHYLHKRLRQRKKAADAASFSPKSKCLVQNPKDCLIHIIYDIIRREPYRI